MFFTVYRTPSKRYKFYFTKHNFVFDTDIEQKERWMYYFNS